MSEVLNNKQLLAELGKHHDARQAALNECAPDVARKLGFDSPDAVVVLLSMPASMHQGTYILQPRLQPAAIRQLAMDLLQDVPKATVIRAAFDHLSEQNQVLGDVWTEQFLRAASEEGLEIKDHAEDGTLTDEWKAVHARVQSTKPFRLSLADVVLASEHLEQALRTWAFSYWPDEITQPKSKREKAPRKNTHPVHDNSTLQVPNDPASVLFTRVVTRPAIWKTNENECHKFAQDGKAVVIYRPDEEIPEYWSDFRERVLQTLESRFTSMKGELVADVADILFWHWLSNERPSYANISLAQILEYRGVKPNTTVIDEHWQAMRDVRAIKLRGHGIESEALFHVSVAQPNLWGTAEPPKLATVYRYHPGYFLSEAIQRDAFFLAYYARNVWQLDYYRDANAKKLARVLRVDWRRNAESYLPGGPPRYRTWKALLADAGIDTESGIAQTDPARFIKAIERELEKLYDIGFVRDCAPAIYHPDDQAKRENLPPKGKLTMWLSLRTHIAPAADITDALTQTATRRLARKIEMKALVEAAQKAKKPRKKAVK